MADVVLTPNLQHHADSPTLRAEGTSVADVLQRVLQDNQRLRTYLLDARGQVRPNVMIFIDGRQLEDRQTLSDPVTPQSEVYITQALAGG